MANACAHSNQSTARSQSLSALRSIIKKSGEKAASESAKSTLVLEIIGMY
jgi:hypothetical protein